MEPEPSWSDYECTQNGYLGYTIEDNIVDSVGKISVTSYEEDSGVCINSVLPDDILEQVMGHLPIATIIKVGCVCKKWNHMVYSESFLQNLSSISAQKPWYFMFTCDSDPYGHVYDPILHKWYRFDIPYVESPSWDLASSSGLVCFMDNDNRRKLYVCNPISRDCRKLEDPPGGEVSGYFALAISLNRSSNSYTVTIVKSKQESGRLLDWDLSVYVYSSKNKMWTSPVDVTLQAWRGGTESVICRGILYFVVYLTTTIGGWVRPRYGVLAYDLASKSFNLDVDQHVISAPCPVTCVRLLNLEEELVMVGGIEKEGRTGLIKGIGVWLLRGNEWEEVSRMPNKFFKGFGEFDEVFACSGFDRLIYVHSYGSPALLMFDMNSREWKWSHRCPAGKKFPLQVFSGICFEPRLDIVP